MVVVTVLKRKTVRFANEVSTRRLSKPNSNVAAAAASNFKEITIRGFDPNFYIVNKDFKLKNVHKETVHNNKKTFHLQTEEKIYYIINLPSPNLTSAWHSGRQQSGSCSDPPL